MAVTARIVEKRYDFEKDFFPAHKVLKLLNNVYNNSKFYREKLKQHGFNSSSNISYQEFCSIPFTEKNELRVEDPLALLAAPEERVVRIHSSSGTTGKPVVIPYTQNDVDEWTEMMARCFAMAGVTKMDRVHITPGYGLWTAGIGFQAGVEKLGAMAVPMGPGNTDKQIEMMIDMKSTVLVGTSSYGLLLAEEINKRGLRDKISLRKGIFGSERWGEKMRSRIEELLGIETYDIYGLTEIYGPGISLDCNEHKGMHYWSDYLFMEVIDPVTGNPVNPGEYGELVITTLTKEAMPLIRYRTRDITRLITDTCPCGCPHPRIDRIIGRSDDMIKVKGVNIYPGQIDSILKEINGLSSEYQIYITREDAKDRLLIKVERDILANTNNKIHLENRTKEMFKTKIGISVEVEVVDYQSLPRSEKKSKRIFDNRFQ